MTDKRRVITNTVANGIAQFAALLSGLVLMPYLVRGFGITNYGLYMLALSVASYASVADLGVGAALVKKIAEHLASDDHEGIRKFASTALAYYLIIGVGVSAIVVVVAMFAGEIFHVDADGARLLRNLLIIAGISALWTWPLNAANAVLQGFQRHAILARTSLFVILANIAVTVGVLVAGQGPVALLLGTSLVTLAGSLANLAFAMRMIRSTRPLNPFDAEPGIMKEILSFSWAIFIIQICVLIVYQQTDRVVLGIFVGAAAVGLYEAAGKFQGLVNSLSGFTSTAVMPVASQLDAEGRSSALQTLFLRGTKYVVAFLGPVVVTLMVLSSPLIVNWLGPEFATMALAAQILISHQLLTIMTPIGDNIIVGQGKLPKRLPNAVGIITIGNLVLSLLLVKPLGILGVVIGTTVPYLVDFPLHLRFLLKETGVPFGEFMRRVALPTYPLLVIPVVLGLLLARTPLMGSLFGVAFAAALCVGAYWLAFLIVGLNKIERDEIKQVWIRTRARLAR